MGIICYFEARKATFVGQSLVVIVTVTSAEVETLLKTLLIQHFLPSKLLNWHNASFCLIRNALQLTSAICDL